MRRLHNSWFYQCWCIYIYTCQNFVLSFKKYTRGYIAREPSLHEGIMSRIYTASEVANYLLLWVMFFFIIRFLPYKLRCNITIIIFIILLWSIVLTCFLTISLLIFSVFLYHVKITWMSNTRKLKKYCTIGAPRIYNIISR